MRRVLAYAAFFLACLAVYEGHATRGRIEAVEIALEPPSITETIRTPAGRPRYVARFSACTWRDPGGADLRCANDPQRREYLTWGSCNTAEWELARLLAAEADRRGFYFAARVNCVTEYDA